MTPTQNCPPEDCQPSEFESTAQLAHAALRMVLAVRYRKNLVAVVMLLAVLLGGLYYTTAERRYSAKAGLLISQSGPDRLDTSVTSDNAQQLNSMPTFERMISSPKVLEGAWKSLPPADRIDLAGCPEEKWGTALQSQVSAKAVRSTSILEISFNSKDPQVAVNVVRAIVQSYLNLMDNLHKGTAGEISKVLTLERQNVAEKLSRKQEELLSCRRQFADMGFRSDGKSLHPMVQRAVFFNDALIAAQKERVEQEAMLATIHTAVERGEDLGRYMISIGENVGREMLLNSLGLSSRDTNTQATLERDLVTARSQLQTIQQHLGPMHPEVIGLNDRIRITEGYLASSQDRVGQRVSDLRKAQLGPWLMQMVQQKLDEARKREEILQKHFEETRTEAISLSGQLTQLELLERDVKRYSDMNDVLLNQIASLDLKQNGQEVRVAVIEEPTVPGGPVWPNRNRVAMLTILAGFAVALGLVTLLDALDDRFRSVDELQSRLGVPLLSMIQQIKAPASTGAEALITHASPTSVASESFRTLRTALTLMHPDAHRIVVTSAEPGDGKTTTLANLAACYAQAEKRTLLVDADLRRPGLTGLMDMRGPHGLSEILRSEVDITQMGPAQVRASGVKDLDIIPSGSRPTDPAELLGSPRFSEFLAWAEATYDMVLIDSPPTLATTDTAIIGRLVDGVIVVVQPAKNRRRLVTRVVERLTFMKLPVLGLVVNRTGSNDEQGYYGYNDYGYGYGYEYNYGSEDGAHDKSHSARSKTPDECLTFRDDDEDADDDAGEVRVIPRRVA